MYDPHQVLQVIDANVVTFLSLSTITLIFNYVFFGWAALTARRDKAFAIPLFLAAFWFAHDVSYLVEYDLWFKVYDHWYLKLFWGGLVATTLLESVFLWQVYRYGKEETMPGASNGIWALYMLGAIVVALVAWFSLRMVLDDPIFAYSFAASGFLTPFLCLKLMLDRGDARGQSLTTWIAYVGMQATWFSTTYSIWGGPFRAPHYVALGVVCVAGGLVMAWAVSRTRGEVAAGGAAAVA